MKKENLLVLDLHGLGYMEAEIKLEDFFISIKNNNLDKVKIISGWGRKEEPIIFTLVNKWLLDRGYSFSNDLGSFTVYLKQGVRQKFKV